MTITFDPRYLYRTTTPNSQLQELWEATGDDWIEYTPTVSAGLTVGAGGSNLAWRKGRGAVGQVHGEIILGTSPTVGALAIKLPADASQVWRGPDSSPDTSLADFGFVSVQWVGYDTSANDYHIGSGWVSSDTAYFFTQGGTSLSSSTPFTWAAGDRLCWQISYIRNSSSKLVE